MNQRPAPSAPASRTQKTYSAITRLLLWGVLTVWGLFVLTWGALHFWIVPRIGEWRPDLERWASQAVGVPVTIGAIRAESQGESTARAGYLFRLVPALEFSEVRLFDPQGREALRLPTVRAAVSVTSLWRQGFEQLLIESPVLDVRRTPQGRIEIAGLDFSSPRDGSDRAADWFFSQTEFVIRNGTVRWTDEQRAQSPLVLTSLQFVSRNSVRSHLLRLDATPPAEWGQPFNLMASLREPLLDLRAADAEQAPWHNWSGEIYADLPAVDVLNLKAYVDLTDWGVQVQGGRGRVRAWADIVRGQVAGVTADLGLHDVATRLGPDLPELLLDTVEGRVITHWDAKGFDIQTEHLGFRTRDGLVWPAGQARLQHDNGLASHTVSTTLSADRVDLSALTALATRVPLPEASRTLLASLQPAGLVDGLSARWQGPVATPGITAYQARGRVSQLALTGQPSGQMSSFGPYPVPGRPGVSGASAEFDLNQDGGSARVAIAQGSLTLPGVFEQTVVPLDSLQADMRWTVKGERIELWTDNLRLANADAAGSGRLRWSTADPARSSAASRFPGVLDLQATLHQADAKQVHRYLPLSVGPEVRRYLREAIRGGRSDRVEFRVRGDLWDLPFHQPGADGEFRIAAQLRGVDYDFLPPHLQAVGEPRWPALQGVDGQLVLDRGTLRLSGLGSGVDGWPRVRMSEGAVDVTDLMGHPKLQVSARTQGPASEVLGFVQRSPIDALLDGALSKATGTGQAGVDFKLQLPLEQPEQITVQGHVLLNGNDLRITPDAPLLERASGSIAFSEKGFRLHEARARLFGGDAAIEGGLQPDPKGGPARTEFRGSGMATAEGLRDGGLGLVSQLFAKASGSAAYQARLGFRGGVPELLVTSALQGLALELPAPLGKRAEDSLPLRYENTVLTVAQSAGGEQARTDRMALDIGPPNQARVAMQYERDISGVEPRVLRGSLAVGLPPDEVAPMPPQGVLANLRFGQVDLDAWEKAFGVATGSGSTAPASASAAMGYLPTMLAVRADEVLVDGRTFRRVVLGGSREGAHWRANIDAAELNGYVEYRQGGGDSGAGSIYARLARLDLAPSAAADVEELLQQPANVPALDITVESLSMSGRQLGLVDIQAVNRGSGRQREWRLNKLNIRVPEARLIASGRWAAGERPDTRRPHLDFRLDIDDAGQLLTRFGRAGVVRGGEGSIVGNIDWSGSPLSPDFASLSGELSMEVQRGQFLKVEPGAAKLLGVLSLQALPRRLTLDFRDVFSDGFAFDFLRGDAKVQQGVATTNNLQMKGINAAVLMEGTADIAREQQDLKVVVVPELNAGTASLIATAINPAVGLGTFLAQFLLREPLQAAATQQFHISGSWADPKVEKVVERKAVPAADTPGLK